MKKKEFAEHTKEMHRVLNIWEDQPLTRYTMFTLLELAIKYGKYTMPQLREVHKIMLAHVDPKITEISLLDKRITKLEKNNGKNEGHCN